MEGGEGGARKRVRTGGGAEPAARALEMRRVGRSELHVPIIGLGCSPLGQIMGGVSTQGAVAAVESAHAGGFRHFDTAPWYGNGMSEARLGAALAGIANQGGAFTVSTKVGRFVDPAPRRAGAADGPWPMDVGNNQQVRYDYGYQALLQQHRESCLRLGLPRVDALAIHDLDEMFLSAEQVQEHLGQLEQGGMRALHELKDRGEIKAVGIGCNPYRYGSLEVCRAVAGMGRGLDYVLLAGPYNLLNQEALDDMLPLCREKGISVFVGAPFASGILAVGARGGGPPPTYMYQPAPKDLLDKCARIEGVCDKYGVALPAAALQFPLFHPCVACVLSGVKSEREASRAREAMDANIPVEFWQELRAEGLIRADAPIAGDSVSHSLPSRM